MFRLLVINRRHYQQTLWPSGSFNSPLYLRLLVLFILTSCDLLHSFPSTTKRSFFEATLICGHKDRYLNCSWSHFGLEKQKYLDSPLDSMLSPVMGYLYRFIVPSMSCFLFRRPEVQMVLGSKWLYFVWWVSCHSNL